MGIVLCEIRSGIISVKQRSSLGIQWSGSLLRKHGYNDVSIFLFEGEQRNNIEKVLLAKQYDICIIEFRSSIREFSYEIIEKLKENNKDIKIIVIGHDATLYAARFMQECSHIDIIIYGEAERTVLEVCNRLKNHKSIDECEGIFYRKSGTIFRNNARKESENLDYLANPALDIAKKQFGSKLQQTVFYSTRTSRGCLGNCSFCSLNRLSNVSKKIIWRERNLKDVIRELEVTQNEFFEKRLVVEFVDNSFEDPDPVNKERIHDFLDLLEKTNLKIAFAILTRTESWTEKDIPLIRRMRKNGLYYIAPGVENSTIAGLKKLNKRGNVESNQRIFKLFQENGVCVHAYMIMFYPYVTFDELRSNADFMKKNNMTGYPFNWYHSMALHPDTEIFQRASRDGLITGFDENTCFYEYQFVDGNIGLMYQLIKKMAHQPVVTSYMNLYEVTRFEEHLFNIWKEQYEKMRTIENIMEEYIKEYHAILYNVGDGLYRLFSDIFDSFYNRNYDNNTNYYIHEWNNLLTAGYEQLDRVWKKNNLILLRKGIKLL